MNFNPQPSQSPQNNQQLPQNTQPPQPVLQRTPQQAPNEIQRSQPPIPMINPNVQYSRYQQQVHPQPKIAPKLQNNRRKNQKAPYPQPFPVNPQPSIDFTQPQLQMLYLKAQELTPERREMFIELVKDIPNKQQQYIQYLNDLLLKFTDDKVYRYFREPRVPHVFKSISAIKPLYYLANFQSQKEFKPAPKDRIKDVIYIASYISFPPDPNFLKILNLQVNNTNVPPQTFGEPDGSLFFVFGTGDKVPPSMILSMARASFNCLCWLVIQAVRIKIPFEFISEYYPQVKIASSCQELHAKCPFCSNFYDAFLIIKEIQRKGDSICPSCRKRITINQFKFDMKSVADDAIEKKKIVNRMYEMMQEIRATETIDFDSQIADLLFKYDPTQNAEELNENQDENQNKNENYLEELNSYLKIYNQDQP